MNPERFDKITGGYPRLRIALIGDFCLDRYLEIDPARQEISIETNRPVHNVVHVRAQPGGAGTILNNLVALGIGTIFPVGFCGEDGEGWELLRELREKNGVQLDYFTQTPLRRTFTYTKPLIVRQAKPPEELDRLDFKNWMPTPDALSQRIADAAQGLASEVEAFIVLDQVDQPGTGVITPSVLKAIEAIGKQRPELLILADSRRGLREFPKFDFKMNAAELGKFLARARPWQNDELKRQTSDLAQQNGRYCFITLAEKGIMGAAPSGDVDHVEAIPTRGEIDVVGAGDAVTANLAASLSAGATLREALELAMCGASVAVHQLGTTGTASVRQLREVLQTKE